MPANFGLKSCEECRKEIILKVKRDVERKRFCSRKCLGLFTGKNKTKEELFKMIKAANTPESNAKKAHKGINHPLYKKDRSLIKSKRPKHENTIWTKSVFERDNYTCQHCNKRGGKLQADHIKPYSICVESRWDINNGRTLCVECHKKTDTYGAKMRWKIARGEYGSRTK